MSLMIAVTSLTLSIRIFRENIMTITRPPMSHKEEESSLKFDDEYDLVSPQSRRALWPPPLWPVTLSHGCDVVCSSE